MLFARQESSAPPPPAADPSPIDYSDDSPGMLGVCSVFIVLATICVALRFWSKRLTSAKWTADDWLILASLILHHGFTAACFIETVAGGLGRDMRLVIAEDPNQLVILFKALFAAELAYGFSSPLVKLSFLCFYWRIFPTRFIRIGCYIIGFLCIGWMISIQVVNLVQCRPLEATWYIEMQALPDTECIDPKLFFLGNSIANCFIDLVTVLLPIPPILKLHTSPRRRLGIAAIFLLGGMAFAASLTRAVTVGIWISRGNDNFTKENVISGVVSVLEIYVAIIGACLPMMIPIYRKLWYGDINGSSNKSTGASKSHLVDSNSKSSKKTSSTTDGSAGSFQRLDDDEWATMNQPNGRTTINSWTDRHPVANIPMDSIAVNSTMTWSDNTGSKV